MKSIEKRKGKASTLPKRVRRERREGKERMNLKRKEKSN